MADKSAAEVPSIPAATILGRNRSPGTWFGTDFTMNLYRGCRYGCIYCDSRSDCYGIADYGLVRQKADALNTLARELAAKRRPGVVGTGSMNDPYGPCEERLLLTQRALALLDRHGFGVSVATKSDRVTRDTALLRRIAAHSPVSVAITVTASDDRLAEKIEPQAPSSSRRLAALGRLREAGVYAGVLLMPLLPFLTDTPENVESIVRAAAENGARFIYPLFGMTLRQGQREFFYRRLDALFPGLTARYRAAYGGNYECMSPRAEELARLFTRLCRKYGLAYEMKEIIRQSGESCESAQQTLF